MKRFKTPEYEYEGEVKEGTEIRHGWGVCVFDNPLEDKRYIYEGWFQDDLFSLEGRTVFEDGSTFEGSFRDGKRNGFGTYKSSTGSLSQGYFKEGKLAGHGIYIKADGTKFVGTFENG